MQEVAVTSPDPQSGVPLGSTPATEIETPTNQQIENLCISCDLPVAPEDQDEVATEMGHHAHTACAEALAVDHFQSETPAEPVAAPVVPEHETQQYEDELTARIASNAPVFLEKSKTTKAALNDLLDSKEELSRQLALKKALLIGKGRDGEWGGYLKGLGLARSTVDRWVEKKFLGGELPQWAVTKLAANKKPEPPKPPTPELSVLDQFIEIGQDRIEMVFAFTADEANNFRECYRVLTIAEIKKLLVDAVTKAAESKRGQDKNELRDLIARARPNPNLNFLDEEEPVVHPETAIATAAGE